MPNVKDDFCRRMRGIPKRHAELSAWTTVRIKQALAFGFAGLLAVLQGQNISEDEIRWGTRPYRPAAEGRIRVQTNLVIAGVVVRDNRGQPTAGLRQSDFRVYDNGKPQTISAFFMETSSARTSAGAADRPGSTPANSAVTVHVGAAERPRFVALFFDDMNMRLGELVAARKAAQLYISESLAPGDRVGVFTSSSTVTRDFTNDAQKLLDSLAQLRSHLKRADGGPVSCPRIGPYQAHLIVNLLDSEAIDLAIAEGVAAGCLGGMSRAAQVHIVRQRAEETLSLAEQFSQDTLGTLQDVLEYLGRMPGRRTLVLTSSGFMTRSYQVQRQQDKLLDAALRADVVINSLDAKGLAAEVPGGDSSDGPPRALAGRPELMAYGDSLRSQQRDALNDPMALLAEGTGGQFFHNNNDLSRGLRELAATPEVSYVIGFSPENLKTDGRFHTLKVRLAVRGHFTVHARRGYYAPTKAAAAQPSPLEKLDAEVLASDSISDIGTEVTTESAKLDSGESLMKVMIHVEVGNLPFQHRGDRSVEKLRSVIALFDRQGNFLAGVEAQVDLAVKDATLAQISGRGLDQRVSLQAPPGTYRLRQVVQELVQGRMGALSRQVEIP